MRAFIILSVFLLALPEGSFSQNSSEDGSTSASSGEPCERLAELVGDVIDWLRDDYYINEATSWTMDRNIQEYRDDVLKQTGIDILSETERTNVACTVLGFTTLREAYDFISEISDRPVPYSYMCKYYKRGVEMAENGQIVELNRNQIKLLYTAAKKLRDWMMTFGFPESFPVSVDQHDANLELLKEIEALFRPAEVTETGARGGNIREMRTMLTKLLPLGPLLQWEQDDNNKNQTTAEEVVSWMESSNNIFDYASFIKTNAYQWLSARRLKENIDRLRMIRENYEKLLWYDEGLKIVLESNLFQLDTSDCPEIEEYRYSY